MAVGDCPLATPEAGSPGRCHQAGTRSSSITPHCRIRDEKGARTTAAAQGTWAGFWDGL